VIPRIAVTVGDPAGIGPEIVAKAIADTRVTAVCEPLVYGPPAGVQFPIGTVSAEGGQAAYDAIVAAVRDAEAGRVHAIATAPVNKLGFARAGLPWKGHTDLLAHLTGRGDVRMLFWSDTLRVVLATVHVPLAEVPRMITRELIERTIVLAARELPAFGIERPRLAVAGLNPHAGEDGVIGDEEQRVLRPAIETAQRSGIDVTGPLPGDTVFVRGARGEFDCVIACYHDQGLIPMKMAAFGRAVNVTLGLPIIRTSVDHGTAFDIAGRGVADPSSLIEAVLLAARLATRASRGATPKDLV
jgi:4-hydroxythreonine-4-phosphate dehydrogenase